MSVVSRSDGAGPKTYVPRDRYSLMMSFWVVPDSCAGVGALLLGDDLVHRQQPHRGGVDRHRRVHGVERDVLEQLAHRAEVRDRYADLADLAAAQLVVGVVAGLRRQVEGDGEAGLALRQVAAVERIGLRGRAVAGVRAHHPGLVRHNVSQVTARYPALVTARPGRSCSHSPGAIDSSHMVNLTRIYTRTGDDGTTNLGDMSTTSKLDLRLGAYADVDEANSQIGFAISLGALDDDVVAVLTHVQNDLFDVGADLSCPVVENPKYPPLRVEPDYIDRLEGWCDHYNDQLDEAAVVHPAGRHPVGRRRCTSRVRSPGARSDRRGRRSSEHGETMNILTAKYLNRLSDLLFILARHANRAQGDVLWKPGGERIPAAALIGLSSATAGQSQSMLLWDAKLRADGDSSWRRRPPEPRRRRRGPK